MGLEDKLREKYGDQETKAEEEVNRLKEVEKDRQRIAEAESNRKAMGVLATTQLLYELRIRDRLEEVRRAWGTGNVDESVYKSDHKIDGVELVDKRPYRSFQYWSLRASYSFYTAYSDSGHVTDGGDYDHGWKVRKQRSELYVLTRIERGNTGIYVTTDTDPKNRRYNYRSDPRLEVATSLPKDFEVARRIVGERIFDVAGQMESPSVAKMRGKRLIEKNIGNYHLAVFRHILRRQGHLKKLIGL